MATSHPPDRPVPVVLVVVHDGAARVVMMRRHEWPQGWWGLISGFIDRGETAEAAAVREVREETGLGVELEGFLGTFCWEYLSDQLYLVFVARATASGLRAGDDAELVQWFDARGAPAPAGSPAARALALFLRQPSAG